MFTMTESKGFAPLSLPQRDLLILASLDGLLPKWLRGNALRYVTRYVVLHCIADLLSVSAV